MEASRLLLHTASCWPPSLGLGPGCERLGCCPVCPGTSFPGWGRSYTGQGRCWTWPWSSVRERACVRFRGCCSCCTTPTGGQAVSWCSRHRAAHLQRPMRPESVEAWASQMLQGRRGGQSDNISNTNLAYCAIDCSTRPRRTTYLALKWRTVQNSSNKTVKLETMKPSSRCSNGVMERRAARPTEAPHVSLKPAPPLHAHLHHLERPSLTWRVREQQPDALAISQKLM